MQNSKKEDIGTLLKKHVFWFSLRLAVLIALTILLETAFGLRLLAFFGTEEIQSIVYQAFRNILFSLYVWFGLAIAKRFLVPIFTVAVSPAIGKVVREPEARSRTVESIRRYLTYLTYLIAVIALLVIWAYSYIGGWIIGFFGTGMIVALTFVLGLFTSSVLGNILAYSVLNSTTEFKTGDRVQIGETYGDVIEIGFFFTRIKTIKDEIISIPNLVIMGKEVKNFSSMKAVLIYVSVTLGYDVDKDEAKRLLIDCAEKTKGVLTGTNKKPFVLLRDLGNYAVTYEINAYTNRPNELVTIKSELIDNILSEFKKSNIEILTPAQIAVREKS